MAARILVVEDNPDSMSLMVYLLRATGTSLCRPSMESKGSEPPQKRSPI